LNAYAIGAVIQTVAKLPALFAPLTGPEPAR